MATTRDDTWRKAEDALAQLGQIQIIDVTNPDGRKPLQNTPEFDAIATLLNEAGDTLEDAIGAKLCNSSWCGCRAKDIASAVREWLKTRAETI